MRIIFMGTPDFAVPALRTLVAHGYHVVAVVTATDKYGGRGGKQLLESAVKRYAVAQHIPVLQPKNLKAPAFVEELQSYRADLQIVVAFRMLPEVVWNMPPLGTFNLHGSLLPRYRGAAPIHWAVINGDTETGVTTFFLQHAIDTGNIILQKSLPIGPDETTGDVHDQMMELGAEAVLETVRRIEAGNVEATVQDESLVSKAPKLYTETCRVDFGQPARTVHNFIRGLSPFPAAWTLLDGKKLKLYRSSLPDASPAALAAPGTYLAVDKNQLYVAAADGWVQLYTLQLQGKRHMDAVDFLNGNRELFE